jgi:hypothetical protein
LSASKDINGTKTAIDSLFRCKGTHSKYQSETLRSLPREARNSKYFVAAYPHFLFIYFRVSSESLSSLKKMQ